MSVNELQIKIVIATHKPYRMPEDEIYLPIHVGSEGKLDESGQPLDLGYVKDNTGDHISQKNPSFCELTGLYWAWKNLDSDYIGLVHYRRYFCLKKKKGDIFESILTGDELRRYIPQYKLFLPKKRNYYIETLYSHYAHTHYAEHLDLIRSILAEQSQDYVKAYDCVMERTSGYMFNMMIMTRELMDNYCSWLFPVLFELEKRNNTTKLSAFQGRLYGRVSEIIFNVWLEIQLNNGLVKASEIMELPVIYTEKIHRWKKGISFLKAKFFHKKYEGSF